MTTNRALAVTARDDDNITQKSSIYCTIHNRLCSSIFTKLCSSTTMCFVDAKVRIDVNIQQIYRFSCTSKWYKVLVGTKQIEIRNESNKTQCKNIATHRSRQKLHVNLRRTAAWISNTDENSTHFAKTLRSKQINMVEYE